MIRARLVFVATLVGASFAAGTALAQATQAPPFTPILAGKKFAAPIRGAADVEYTKPVLKRDKENVVMKVQIKNVSKGPINRLTIDETWYDKGGATIAGGKGSVNGLLQPDEIQTVTIEMPYNPKLANDKMQMVHANGTVNTHLVAKMAGGTAKDAAAAKGKK